jgi:hypothetical protein
VAINSAVRNPTISIEHCQLPSATAGMSIRKDLICGDLFGVFTSAANFVTYSPKTASIRPVGPGGVLGLGGTFGAGGALTSCSPNALVAPTNGTTTYAEVVNSNGRFFNARGCKLRFVGGAMPGEERTVADVVGATSSTRVNLVFDTPLPFSCASESFLLFRPTWFVLNAGALGATNARFVEPNSIQATANTTGLTGPLGSGGALCATPSFVNGQSVVLVTGTISDATSSTQLTVSASISAVSNQWRNYQIRMTSGAAKGSVRRITSSSTIYLTVSDFAATYGMYPIAATPSAGDSFVIEPCDEFIYYAGNNSTALMRYSTVSGTWTQVATTSNPIVGTAGLDWVHDIRTFSTGTTNDTFLTAFKNAGTIIFSDPGNPRFYNIAQESFDTSFIGGLSGNNIYGPGGSAYEDGVLYFFDNTNFNKVLSLNLLTAELTTVATLPTAQSSMTGQRLFIVKDTSGRIPKKRLGVWPASTASLYWVNLE